jgi:hypothetical protein
VKCTFFYPRARRVSRDAAGSQLGIDPGSQGAKVVDGGRPGSEPLTSVPTGKRYARHPALARGAALTAAVVAVLAVAATVSLSGGARNNTKVSVSMARAQLPVVQDAADRITSSAVSTQATLPTSTTTAASSRPSAPTTTATPIRSGAAKSATPTKVAATTAVVATTARECSVALAYLAAHAKPGFAHYCRPVTLKVGIAHAVAYTCVPGTKFKCPYGGPEIIIADPACAISYENEASNSYWNFSSGAVITPGSVQSGRTWDPYGECS